MELSVALTRLYRSRGSKQVRKERKKVKGCSGLKEHTPRFSASFVRIRHDRKFSRVRLWYETRGKITRPEWNRRVRNNAAECYVHTYSSLSLPLSMYLSIYLYFYLSIYLSTPYGVRFARLTSSFSINLFPLSTSLLPYRAVISMPLFVSSLFVLVPRVERSPRT